MDATIPSYLDRFRPELEAFFANTAAASQAHNLLADVPGSTIRLHYLRTTNPLKPGSLALRASRPGSLRANAYPAPGSATGLAQGLPVLDPRACGAPTPAVSGPPNAFVSPAVLGLLGSLGVAPAPGAPLPAPLCVTAPAGPGLFPHVLEDPR